MTDFIITIYTRDGGEIVAIEDYPESLQDEIDAGRPLIWAEEALQVAAERENCSPESLSWRIRRIDY